MNAQPADEACGRSGPLPYPDTKPQGAADFYFGINATFRFLLRKFGREKWIAYLRDMAADYYRPVWERWRREGLDGVARYLQAAFAAEPGAVFHVRRDQPDRVVLEVCECPAIKHLRKAGRVIVPEFCQHCYFQFSAMAASAGLHMRLEGGNGACRQLFTRTEPPPQDFANIKEAQ